MTAQLEVRSQVAGTVWKIETKVGAKVACGDPLIIIESMKMEIAVEAPRQGTVLRLLVAESDIVADGQVLAVLG